MKNNLEKHTNRVLSLSRKSSKLKCCLTILFLMFFLQRSNAQVRVSSSGGNTNPTIYLNLKTAFDEINNGTHAGAISISITGNTTETSTCILNASGTGNSSYSSITISPSGGQTRIISGAAASGSALIHFKGADNITINGKANNLGDSLFIVNTTISNSTLTSTILYNDGASNNSITNCKILGSTQSNTAGIITIGGDVNVNGTGNDNISIINNWISGNSSNFAKYCIYSTGVVGKLNDSISIDGNSIYNYGGSVTVAAIYLSSYTGNTSIKNNHIFQTIPNNSTGTFYGIYCSNTATHQIIDNYIGGSEKFCGGNPTQLLTNSGFRLIYLGSSANSKSKIQGNRISNFSIVNGATNTGNSLIYIVGGEVNIGDEKPNILGDTLINNSIDIISYLSNAGVSGILCESGNIDTIIIKNNFIAGIRISGTGGMYFRGIDVNNNSAKLIIKNNQFGSKYIPNSMCQLSNNHLMGIHIRAAFNGFTHQITNNRFTNFYNLKSSIKVIYTLTGSVFNISNNEISNIRSKYSNNSLSGNAALIGIVAGAGGAGQTLKNNRVYNLSIDTNLVSTIIGIIFSNSSSNNIVDGNFIHSLNTLNAAGLTSIIGLYASTGTSTYANNMIRLGIEENGSSNTKSTNITGILEVNGTNNYYHNSVHIGGSGVINSTNDTHGFLSISSSGSRTLFNNIFSNTRSNANGSALNYSIGINTLAGSALKNNVLYSGVNFLVQNLNQTITSISDYKNLFQDSTSFSINPNFKNPNAGSNTVDLHLLPGTSLNLLESSAIPIPNLNYDFDNENRPGPNNSTNGGGLFPDIGADEFDGMYNAQCSAPAVGNTIATDTLNCDNTGTKLSLSELLITGNANSFQWEKSTDGINYLPIIDARDSTYLVIGLMSDAYFRCKVTCNVGAISAISTPILIRKINLAITSIVQDTVCFPATAIIKAYSNVGDVYWYDNINATTPLAVGNTFTIHMLPRTKTFYVESKYKSCISNVRYPVTVYVYQVPVFGIKSALNDTLCNPDSVQLIAKTSIGITKWYSDINDSIPIYIGDTLTMSVDRDTVVYAEPNEYICTGSRVPFSITLLNSLPKIDSIQNDTICVYSSATIRAFSNSGDVYWYEFLQSTVPIASGSTFITPILSASKSYFAKSKTMKCEGNMQEVMVLVNPEPMVSIIKVNDTLASNALFKEYTWYKDNIAIPNSNVNKIKVNTSGIYYLAAIDSNGCRNISDTLNVVINGMELNKTVTYIYPNPVFDVLNIKNDDAKYIDITNLHGVLMLHCEYTERLTIENFDPGIYTLKLMDSRKNLIGCYKILKMGN